MSDSLRPPWSEAYKAPPSTELSRQKHWRGLPFPSPGDLPNPGIEARSPALQADTLPSEPPGKQKKWKWKGWQVPLRHELGSLDSESKVLTITPWSHASRQLRNPWKEPPTRPDSRSSLRTEQHKLVALWCLALRNQPQSFYVWPPAFDAKAPTYPGSHVSPAFLEQPLRASEGLSCQARVLSVSPDKI